MSTACLLYLDVHVPSKGQVIGASHLEVEGVGVNAIDVDTLLILIFAFLGIGSLLQTLVYILVGHVISDYPFLPVSRQVGLPYCPVVYVPLWT